ncbi:serine/threonine-protein kinase [Pyrus ussuriensis x Pyrus communis]|uniref:Serine/threonine-protein kinase n=1 Tax=Pyrus ussuriensis x Pyrus communis TaxID=2448454 RepID=A0A5N5IJC0_9ROSA|nr:serine/threonine-protein kinase [Pyrus ussuriensis x Pyrus communis]
MSVASSFPCIKTPPASPSSCSHSSSCSSNHSFMLSSSSSTKPYYVKFSIRSSQTEGPIRRPGAPSLREPSRPSSPLTPTPPSPPSPSPPPQQPSKPEQVSGLTMVEDMNAVTLEFQRQKAKEIQEYFKQKKLEEANQGPFFGFVGKNEISNGRWAMFGFAVGMLTEILRVSYQSRFRIGRKTGRETCDVRTRHPDFQPSVKHKESSQSRTKHLYFLPHSMPPNCRPWTAKILTYSPTNPPPLLSHSPLVSTHRPMGCVQAKPLTNSTPGGLEKLKLDNGYVANGPLKGHRRSTGQFHRDRFKRQQQRGEARISNVEPGSDGSSNENAAAAVVDEWGVLNGGSEGEKDDGIRKVSHKVFVDDGEIVDGWPKWLADNISREILTGLVPKSADSYDKLDKVGEGTYSNVYKARDRDSGKIVALKKVRFDTSEPESVKFMAREIMFLRKLDHPNVVKLEGLATSRMQYSIYLVFGFMVSDLTRIISSPEGLTEPQVKCYMHQLLSGLQHCHERGIVHRDIKGSNLLIDKSGMLKIADFGLANYYVQSPKRPLTNRVVTLWYRAPELLLGSTDYGVGIDLWSAGCVLAEMFTGRPLLPGRTEVEQLHRIFRLCGTPSEEYWKRLKLSTTFRPPRSYKPSLQEAFKGFPISSLGLLSTLLALDPVYRGSASSALRNEFFFRSPLACELSGLPIIYNEDEELKLANEQKKSRNSKVRRSRTRERRRQDVSAEKVKETSASSKQGLQEQEKTVYSNFESEPGSTTSSNSSSANQAGRKESPIFSLSPVEGLSGASKYVKNLPPLPKSKARATSKDNQINRSASTREFRRFNPRELEDYALDD